MQVGHTMHLMVLQKVAQHGQCRLPYESAFYLICILGSYFWLTSIKGHRKTELATSAFHVWCDLEYFNDFMWYSESSQTSHHRRDWRVTGTSGKGSPLRPLAMVSSGSMDTAFSRHKEFPLPCSKLGAQHCLGPDCSEGARVCLQEVL